MVKEELLASPVPHVFENDLDVRKAGLKSSRELRHAIVTGIVPDGHLPGLGVSQSCSQKQRNAQEHGPP